MATAPQGINNPNYDPKAPPDTAGSLDPTITATAPVNAPLSPTAPSGGTTSPVSESYTIKKGDTLGKIAQKSGISLADLLAGNAQYQKNPNLIRPGQTVNVSKKYQDIHSALKDKPPVDSGAASRAAIQSADTTPVPTTPTLPTTPNVDAFMQSPGVLEIAKQIMSVLDPQANRDELMAQMTKIKGEQDVLSAEQLQMMNIKNVMSGTADDIRAEITKAGGTATESQIQAMSAARNKTLIKQATFLQDQMSYQQNLVANDTSLLDFEKTMANDKFNQTFKVLEMVQTNQTNMQNAFKDNFNNMVTNIGYTGAAAKMSPIQRRNTEMILGYPQGFLDNPPPTKTQVSEELAQERFVVSEKNADKRLALQLAAANRQASAQERANRLATAREASLYTGAINKTIASLYPTGKSPIQNYNSSQAPINRIDVSIKQALDPKNPNKGPADLDLIDSYVAIARPGQQVTETQFAELAGSLGLQAKWDVGTQKVLAGSAILNDGNRKEIYALAHEIYNGQKKLADKSIEIINSRLAQIGVPDTMFFTSPEQIDTQATATDNVSGPLNVSTPQGMIHFDSQDQVDAFYKDHPELMQ